MRIVYLVVAMLSFVVGKLNVGKKTFGKIILCYHGVNEQQKAGFLKQLGMIKTRIVASKDLDAMGEQGSNLLVCLTFDDAFANILLNVVPAITNQQIPITIFIPTGSLGSPPFWLQGSGHSDSLETVISVNQLLALKENPLVNFGSHTIDHFRLSSLKVEEIHKQLHESLEMISGIIGKKITELALPYGDFNNVVLRIALEEGYQKIYTLEPEVYIFQRNFSAHLFGRFSVSPDDWPIEFYLTINGAYAWLHSWRAFLRKLKN